MNRQNNFSKALSIAGLFVLACAFATAWNATRVSAFNPQPDPPAFGAIGITREQTALISTRLVENPTRNGSLAEANDRRRARPVHVELDFEDSNGYVLARSVETIEPGHAVSFALNGGDLPIRGDGMRVQVQPCVRILNNPNAPEDAQLIGSLEVFDNFGPDAGKTRFAGWDARPVRNQ